MDTIKTHDPSEAEIFDAFIRLINNKDVDVRQTAESSPEVTISAHIDGKSLVMKLRLNVGRDAVEMLQYSLHISCSCTITLDNVQVIYASDISKMIAMYMGGKLDELKRTNDKPAKEAAYKAFEKLIK